MVVRSLVFRMGLFVVHSPGIVAEEHSPGGHEQADHDGGSRAARNWKSVRMRYINKEGQAELVVVVVARLMGREGGYHSTSRLPWSLALPTTTIPESAFRTGNSPLSGFRQPRSNHVMVGGRQERIEGDGQMEVWQRNRHAYA